MPEQYWEQENKFIKANNASVLTCPLAKPFYNSK
jgi:hypothetical protein